MYVSGGEMGGVDLEKFRCVYFSANLDDDQ